MFIVGQSVSVDSPGRRAITLSTGTDTERPVTPTTSTTDALSTTDVAEEDNIWVETDYGAIEDSQTSS